MNSKFFMYICMYIHYMSLLHVMFDLIFKNCNSFFYWYRILIILLNSLFTPRIVYFSLLHTTNIEHNMKKHYINKRDFLINNCV